jgi:putative tryptophan/tyrosine transport system substrate-binding protein
VTGKRLQLLKQLAPKTVRIVVLGNATSPIEVLAFRETQAAATAVGLEVHRIDARTPDDHAVAFAAVTASSADAMHVVGNPANFKNGQAIADFALDGHLPSSYEERAFALAGGLISTRPATPIPTFEPRPTSTRSSRAPSPGSCRSSIRRSSSW